MTDTLLADEIKAFFKNDFELPMIFSNGLQQHNAIIEDLKNYQGTDPKSKILRGRMLQHPLHDIKCSDNLREVMKYIESAINSKVYPADHPILAKLESLFALWTSICSLKQLDRFLSWDQPPLRAAPFMNGNNLEDMAVNPYLHDGFEFEQILQRFTIRILHLPGILQFTSNAGAVLEYARFLAIHRLCTMGRVLLQEELKRVAANANDDFARYPSGSAANWLRVSRKNIVAALEVVATIATFRPGVSPEELDRSILTMREERTEAGLRPLTNEEEVEERELLVKLNGEKTIKQKLDENFAEKDFLFLDGLQKEMSERLMEEMALDPLLIDLIRREDDFEAALAVEHYEEKLITKQISIIDEQQLAETDGWMPSTSIQSLNDAFDAPEIDKDGKRNQLKELETIIFKLFHDMSLVNRHRRDFRLLRDWAGKRPWKQIYQLYDSTNSAEPEWVRTGVTEFDGRVILPFQDEDNQTPAPTSFKKIIPKIFGFLPIDIASYSKTKYGCDFRQDLCTLCKKRYYQGRSENPKGFGSTVMELHCKDHHRFHLKCIFEFWDGRGKYLHTCPRCGDMAKLNYETVGLNPAYGNFAHNNQNYNTAAIVATHLHSEHPTIAKKARELYDVPPVPLFPREEGDDPMDLDKFPDPPATAAGRAYFESEIQYHVGWMETPIVWLAGKVGPGEKARNMISSPTEDQAKILSTGVEAAGGMHGADSWIDFRNHQSRSQGKRGLADRVAKKAGDMWLKREFERGRDDVYDVDSVRILPAARLAPSMEAAMMRGARRRREYKLRERIKREGRGLGGL
ncbi:hypothetical protein BKA65DRAFT_537021 [Rhexocercosporidium sp. MPI-PUGE-AT-0058]|nr:hypothetical protein BKA65DRAFT_537021 [Rhexocercosporidium sp. MPI-PUGE-AT-0058]